MHRLRIEQINIEDLKKIKMFVIRVAIESLLYLPLSQPKGKFLYPLKHELVQKVHAKLYSTFLFSFTIITQLLLAYLKSELYLLLPVSEMVTFHILALNFGG